MGQTKKVMRKRLVAMRMNEMPRKKLEWLWPERIALGTLTVLAGDFQSGKSLLAADLAARVSRGDAWPDGRPGLGPSQVLLLTHEDDSQAALDAAGAEMSRIVALDEIEESGVRSQESEGGKGDELEVVKRRPINLTMDLDALEEQLAGMENCRMVIIDPVDAHLTGGNTVAARMWLRSLRLIAAKYQVAMVLVTRLKDGRKLPLDRLAGGMGLAGAARAVWVTAPGVRGQESGVRGEELSVVGCQLSEGDGSAEPSYGRLLLGVKNNLSGERMGLAYRLVVDEERDAPRVEWSSEVVTETVEEVMEALRQKSAKPAFAVSQAIEFLREALAGGPRLIREVVAEAKEREGISRASLERARKEMKVRAIRKMVPGAWWICLKEDKAVVEGVEGLEGNPSDEGNGEETRGYGDAKRCCER